MGSNVLFARVGKCNNAHPENREIAESIESNDNIKENTKLHLPVMEQGEFVTKSKTLENDIYSKEADHKNKTPKYGANINDSIIDTKENTELHLPVIEQGEFVIKSKILENGIDGLEKLKEETKKDSGAKHVRAVTIYETEKILLQRGHFIRDQDCHLYYYNGKIYVLANGLQWDEFVKTNLPENVLQRIKEPCFYQKLLHDMRSNPRIRKVRKEDAELNTKYLIAFNNGVYDILTGRFDKFFCPEHLIFSKLDADFKEYPNITEFKQFISDITGNDEDAKTLLWQMTAYIGIANNDGKVFFVLGTAANSGKSVLLRLYETFFEPEETNRLELHAIKGTFAFASLSNKRINISPECIKGKIREEVVTNIKLLTGENYVNIEKKCENAIKEKINCKLLFAANSGVVLESMDEAFFNRMIIVPFLYSIDKDSQDMQLYEKLLKEKNDIISYAVKNYALPLVESNYQFVEPEASKKLKSDWMQVFQPVIQLFIEECCIVTNEESDYISSTSLYNCYCNWMEKNYPEIEIKVNRAFTREIRANYISCPAGAVKEKINGKYVRVVRGLKMKEENSP